MHHIIRKPSQLDARSNFEKPSQPEATSDMEGRAGRDGERRTFGSKPTLPRWVALIFLAVCLGLIPQIINLSSSLGEVEVANHWRTVWVGLDIAEAGTFLLTAWFLFRGSVLVVVTASMAAALLWLDAWFDVLTAFGRADIVTATNLAVFVEVPLGIFCIYVAIRRLRAVDRRDLEIKRSREADRR